ncbi:MAG: hypothetical protein ABI589_08150, partial [Burkholderiales bacterium]
MQLSGLRAILEGDSKVGNKGGDKHVHTAREGPVTPKAGVVTAVRGSVVDVRFDGRLPTIRTLLRAGIDGAIAIEVLTQLDARHVRGIALTPTQGL